MNPSPDTTSAGGVLKSATAETSPLVPTPLSAERCDTTGPEPAAIDVDESRDAASTNAGDCDDGASPNPVVKSRMWQRIPVHRKALAAAVTLLILLGTLAGWMGLQVYRSHQSADLHARFVQTARQGALNLTTIDYQHAEADVQRILDSSTGTFRDDFAKRSQDFIDAVKQAQSHSEGTITVAGLESSSGNQAQVLVAANVKISDIVAPEQKPRSWRMRIIVEEAGDDMKVSNVEFVP